VGDIPTKSAKGRVPRGMLEPAEKSEILAVSALAKDF
jgi:hypothetical protein